MSDSVILWTVATKQEYWSELPCPSPGSSRPRDPIHISYVSCIDRQVLYHQHHLGISENRQLILSFWGKKVATTSCYQIHLPLLQRQHQPVLEKEMATHSRTLAWKIPWMEEPGRLKSMESHSRTGLSNFTGTGQYSCLESPMDRETWKTTVRGVAKSRTQMSMHAQSIDNCVRKNRGYGHF